MTFINLKRDQTRPRYLMLVLSHRQDQWWQADPRHQGRSAADPSFPTPTVPWPPGKHESVGKFLVTGSDAGHNPRRLLAVLLGSLGN